MSEIRDIIDIAIIGGGASGMMAGLSAAMYAQDKGRDLSIVIFERNDRVGKKLLMTGNGRCNLTNTDQDFSHYHGEDASFCRGALHRFSREMTSDFFSRIGVLLTEEEGKMYPLSLHASSVLDAFRLALKTFRLDVRTGSRIVSLEREAESFRLRTSEKEFLRAKKVIVAVGGVCAPITGSDGSLYPILLSLGHTLVEPLPSIVQLRSNSLLCKPLSGIKCNAEVRLYIDGNLSREDKGEVLFTDYGLSGPPILQLSGNVSRAVHRLPSPEIFIETDFLPACTDDEVIAMLFERREMFSDRIAEDFLVGVFQNRMAISLMKLSFSHSLHTSVHDLTDHDLITLAKAIKHTRIMIQGTQPFSSAQTTIGGLKTRDFHPASLESRRCPGLYATGELLDIDGDCGGYNLQWAWSSGYVAGHSAARSLMEKHI